MPMLGGGMIGRVMLVLAAAIEIACSGADARPDKSSSGHATFGNRSDCGAAQCTDAGAAQRALLGRGHICAAAETHRGDHGNDWKSMSHGSTSAFPAHRALIPPKAAQRRAYVTEDFYSVGGYPIVE
jgi:hypothetical protein